MKKLVTLMLSVIILFSLCGCEDSTDISDSSNDHFTDSSDLSVQGSSLSAFGYLDIPCRNIGYDEWKTIRISGTNSGIMLQLDIPSDWTVTPINDTTYNILRNGKKIGYFTTRDLPQAKPLKTFKLEDTDRRVTFRRSILPNESNGYLRTIEFDGYYKKKTISVNFSFPYEEADEQAVGTISLSALTVPEANPFLPSDNGSDRILILGNSFINTSKITDFLNDMLVSGATGYHADSISVGFGRVATFTSDTQLCRDIRGGKYAYVVQCGFHDVDSAEHFAPMVDNCQRSNTGLIIFPAHNEFEKAIKEADALYDYAHLLDWRNEINMLLDSGVAASDLHENDSFWHTKSLGGYVGAHMIYRSIFEKTPPKLTKSAPLSNSEVRLKLGDYVDCAGLYARFDKSKIFEINEYATPSEQSLF